MRYTVGDLTIDVEGERASRDGREIPLPKLSFDLLLALVRAAPALVPVRRLLEQVWPGVVVGPETVSQRIKLLREVLGDSVDQPRYIASVRGQGYRIIAPVAAVQTPQQQADPAVRIGPASGTQSGRLLLGGGFLVLAALLALGWMSRATLLPGRALASNAAVETPAALLIAVLPLDNLSPDPANAFFADGMHAEIISALAQQAPALDVISRTTMLTFREHAPPVADIRSHLGATHVLEGSLRREADQLRLTLQLIDARSDTNVWSKTYDRTLVSTLTLQSEVAADVAAQLALRLPAGAHDPAPPTRDPLAYDFYLKALLARGDAATLAAHPAAVRAFTDTLSRAIERDPQFAAAYAERVAARTNSFLLDGDAQVVPTILADLETAERLAPGDPKVMAARALYLGHVEQDYAQAVAAFEAAERAGLADPVWVKSKMWPLLALGRFEDVLHVLQRCVALDPKNIELLLRYAYNLELNGRPEESLRTLELGLAQAPDNLQLLATRGAQEWRRTGRPEELRRVVASGRARALAQLDRGIVLTTELNLARILGQFDQMQRLLDEADIALLRSNHVGVGPQPIARLQGWTSLLRKDAPRAARAGRELLQHLHQTPETRWNRGFRLLLAADAHTFMGQKPEAIASAREALQLASQAKSYFLEVTELEVAVVYAWNGADADAVAILERLTSTAPMLGPAEVARDPLFNIPLAASPGYRALADRLEAQIRAATFTADRVAQQDPRQQVRAD